LKREIIPVAYSPVGRLDSKHTNTVESVNHPYVVELANKYDIKPV